MRKSNQDLRDPWNYNRGSNIPGMWVPGGEEEEGGTEEVLEKIWWNNSLNGRDRNLEIDETK